jgi:ketosteroid isomerase-like protein
MLRFENEPPPEVEAAIRRELDDYVAATLEQDWDRFLDAFDASPLCMPAGAGAMRSRDEIGAFYSQFPKLDALSLTPERFEQAGSLVIEIGRYEFVAGGMEDVGKYVHLWRQQEDGSWKLYRNIANSDGPG